MRKTCLSGVLALALAASSVTAAHAGATVATPSNDSNNDVVVAVFVLALGALIFGQGFGQQNRKVTQKKAKTSEF